jgi:ribosomal protein S18 acetylase RimI-like enzyme
MHGIEIRPFADEHIEPAARLLAARHARHRLSEPSLPETVDFGAQIKREWEAEGASGVFATTSDEPVGYLFGRPAPYGDFATWMLVGIAGHAVEGDSELVRDLYAAAAETWVESGQSRHGVFVPASDAALVDAWFRLCFGASGALGARETSREAPFDAGIEIRRGTPDDLAETVRLDLAMSESMLGSPSFSGMTVPPVAETEEGWRDTWTGQRFEHFVAERDGRIVGQIVLYRRPPDLRVPPSSIDLAHASTEPGARGSGIGRALTEHVLAWAQAAGIATMVTDWRMTNLYASRFWPRRGFRPTFLRLYRSIP